MPEAFNVPNHRMALLYELSGEGEITIHSVMFSGSTGDLYGIAEA